MGHKGFGVVEIILILATLIILVAVFREKIIYFLYAFIRMIQGNI